MCLCYSYKTDNKNLKTIIIDDFYFIFGFLL